MTSNTWLGVTVNVALAEKDAVAEGLTERVDWIFAVEAWDPELDEDVITTVKVMGLLVKPLRSLTLIETVEPTTAVAGTLKTIAPSASKLTEVK